MRILVTGSRNWQNERLLCEALNEFRSKDPRRNDGGGHILVSGACPTGADRMAEDYAADIGWQIERHPANWKTYGKAAGFRRNLEMVRSLDPETDICLAFIRDNSKGASMTYERAQQAGVETRVWRE